MQKLLKLVNIHLHQMRARLQGIRFSTILFFLVFIVQCAQILFFKQALLLDKYDTSYWKDRYEHSQYQLPLSQRIIGDDGLFSYAGYRIAQGDAPFSINV